VNQLTQREKEVAALAAAGLPAKEIADRLGIAQGTVKRHLRNIYAKLGIHSQVKLALTWLERQKTI
jgi:two-component system nitrate/nitrite response regulator NarL